MKEHQKINIGRVVGLVALTVGMYYVGKNQGRDEGFEQGSKYDQAIQTSAIDYWDGHKMIPSSLTVERRLGNDHKSEYIVRFKQAERESNAVFREVGITAQYGNRLAVIDKHLVHEYIRNPNAQSWVSPNLW